MTHRTSRALRALLLVPALALAPLSACSPAPGEPPLAGARIGGAFSLVNQDGQRVTDRSFAGQYRLMYFGFANCPDVCPTDLQVIGAGMRRFETDHADLAARVTPIFVTVDPARDTPDVMKRYVAAFHPRMVGLTGTVQEIDGVKRAFGIYAQADPPNAEGAYNVNHTRYILLMGPDNQPIALIPHDQGPEALAAELARWVR